LIEKLVEKDFLRPNSTTRAKISLEEIMMADVVLLLFSGAWCPPCRGFLPVLKKFYKEINKGCTGPSKRVEIIFVSCDNEKDEFVEHFQEL